MTRTKTWLALIALSLAALSLMHLVHGSFHHDSFAYLATAEHFLGRTDAFDARRVTLFTFLLMPFADRPALLYVFLTVVAWLALFVVTKIVDLLGPRSELHYLLLIIPSYTTYILTSILQEGPALLLLALSLYALLRRRYAWAVVLSAVCVFIRPAMSTLAPGILLALLYHKHAFRGGSGGAPAPTPVRGRAGLVVRDGLVYGALFLAACAACAAPLLLLTRDPLVSFKILAGVYIRDDLMRLAFPVLGFSLFGVLVAPLLLYAVARLYKERRRVFVLFAMVFLPYLVAVWYQANIRYLVYLIIPAAVAVSGLNRPSWKPALKAAALALLVLSCLYPFGPFVYYYDYTQGRRVIGRSAKPFIFFDSEYKGRQYRELRRLMEGQDLRPAERLILEAYQGTPILDYLRRHPE